MILTLFVFCYALVGILAIATSDYSNGRSLKLVGPR